MNEVPTWLWGVLGAHLLLSGFFSSSETALFSLTQQQRARSGVAVLRLLRKPRRLLVSVLLLNLVVNAAHAVAEGEKIRIVTSAEDGRVVVQVEDEGCGIEGDDIDRVFDPFFTTKPVGEGTGLGLSISYESVQSHDGNMSVSSTPGRGTSVRVELPAADESALEG